MAAFTLVVMTVSSTYSPVPSFCGVPAQPTTDTRETATKTAERSLLTCLELSLVMLVPRVAIERRGSILSSERDAANPLERRCMVRRAGAQCGLEEG
jgi:hypothetical protein